ncbi:MAG: hypothetical protein ACKVU4_13730 [Phycisphaerales bacterium]
MNDPGTVAFNVHFARGAAGALELREGVLPPPPVVDRVPRVARLMALAIRIRRSAGEGGNDAQVARAAGVTRARVAQVVALLWLAPDLQEEILFLTPAESGREPITERTLRPIAAEVNWYRQRRMWRALRLQKQHRAVGLEVR